jgi:uncharacterized membrane protein
LSTLLYLYIGGGLLLSALSIPLILGKISPNGLYGFRVPQTLDNPDLWYPVNTYAGWRLLVTGLGTILAALILSFVPNITLDTFALACMCVFFLLLGVGLWQSIHFLKHLAKKETRKEE